jgi:hypothetical protein
MGQHLVERSTPVELRERERRQQSGPIARQVEPVDELRGAWLVKPTVAAQELTPQREELQLLPGIGG